LALLATIEPIRGRRTTACLDEIVTDVIAHELAGGAWRVQEGDRIGRVKPTARADDPQPWPALSVPDSVVWVDVEADAESELVLFNSEADTYHSLDPAAGFVWRSIARGDGMVKIVAALSSRYVGDGVVILRDVRAFIDEAIGLGLLAVAQPVR
jgi:hypothetical protein